MKRTTIRIDDRLLAEAKARAARSGQLLPGVDLDDSAALISRMEAPAPGPR